MSISKYHFIIVLSLLGLTACGGGSSDDSAGFHNVEPSASFINSAQSGAVPLVVDFDASNSIDTDGSLINYAWNFGDSNTGEGMVINHSYTVAGFYTVSLTVTDNMGATDQTTMQISVGTSNNNPDNYTAATNIYFSKDYSSEDSNDLWRSGSGSVVSETWGATIGFNNSGAWKLTPTMAPLPNEVNAGLSGGNGLDIPYNDTQVMIISYMIDMSQNLADAISSGTGGFWQHGNKIIDVFNWDTTFQSQGERSTRQIIKVRSNAGQMKFSHLVGGAGSEFYDDGTNQNLRFEQNANQWIWISHVFDATNQVTRTYYKRQSDLSVSKALERFSTDGPDSYSYSSAGWTLLQPGGGPARSIWGYWDDIGGIDNDPNLFVIIDNLRITNGWVEPPF